LVAAVATAVDVRWYPGIATLAEQFTLGQSPQHEFFPLPSSFYQTSISKILPARVSGDRFRESDRYNSSQFI
jgi:hypothetical protein